MSKLIKILGIVSILTPAYAAGVTVTVDDNNTDISTYFVVAEDSNTINSITLNSDFPSATSPKTLTLTIPSNYTVAETQSDGNTRLSNIFNNENKAKNYAFKIVYKGTLPADCSSLFAGNQYGLVEVDLSEAVAPSDNVNTINSTSKMFENCADLTKVILPNDFELPHNNTDMFDGCTKLLANLSGNSTAYLLDANNPTKSSSDYISSITDTWQSKTLEAPLYDNTTSAFTLKTTETVDEHKTYTLDLDGQEVKDNLKNGDAEGTKLTSLRITGHGTLSGDNSDFNGGNVTIAGKIKMPNPSNNLFGTSMVVASGATLTLGE